MTLQLRSSVTNITQVGQGRSTGTRINQVALPLVKCPLVYIMKPSFHKGFSGWMTIKQGGLSINSLLRVDLGLREGLWPMPGRSHFPDGQGRMSGQHHFKEHQSAGPLTNPPGAEYLTTPPRGRDPKRIRPVLRVTWEA